MENGSVAHQCELSYQIMLCMYHKLKLFKENYLHSTFFIMFFKLDIKLLKITTILQCKNTFHKIMKFDIHKKLNLLIVVNKIIKLLTLKFNFRIKE
jgi:hypothetical protein